MIRVILYSKPDCHLCDVVKDVISRVGARYSFELQIRNILDDPEDYQRYRTEIPVVLVNGREIARHRLSEATLEAAIRDPSGG